MKKVLGIVFAIVTLVVAFKVSLRLYVRQHSGVVKPVVLNVKKGSGLGVVASQLKLLGVIENRRLFVKVGQLSALANNIKYGEYLIEPTDSYGDIYKKITSGDNLKYEVTFVEGDHYYKYARQVEAAGLGKAQDFINIIRNQEFIKKITGKKIKTLEGYLFPETYQFSKIDGVRVIASTMVSNFLKETQNLNFLKSGMNRHQVITLASIIEKETGAAHERPLISSVFHNRLKKKMRLQTDPTILYGIMDKTGRETNNIRKKDILAPTAYNTYVIKGLPPGPISNPGLASIKAALNPAQSNYFYFVSQNDGTHVFTTSYKDHKKAVNKYQKNPKMRKGKSWRDLKKNKVQ